MWMWDLSDVDVGSKKLRFFMKINATPMVIM